MTAVDLLLAGLLGYGMTLIATVISSVVVEPVALAWYRSHVTNSG